LRWSQNRSGAARPAPFGLPLSLDRFVLPRWLRRPVRLFARLNDGEFQAPPFSATVLSAVLLASSSIYGGYLGGHLDGFVQGVTARTGFAVDQIKVVGNQRTSEIDVLGALGLDGWTSLIGFDVGQARERVAQLPWVEQAAVRKVYPHTLEVKIAERAPFALLQQGSKLDVIERSGRVIVPYSGGKDALLPLLVGSDAAAPAPEFLAEIDRYPDFASRIKAYIRVGGRRWDLRLENGITVKLPEEDEAQAIADIVRLEHEKGLLERDIVTVDMRISNRLIVELTPDGVKARQTALKEAEKSVKRRAEARI
jgi:cell division protein FtsQ